MSKSKAFEVIQGDCLKSLPKFGDGEFKLIVADPPWNIGWPGYDPKVDDKRQTDSYIAWCRKWVEECYRLCDKHGTFWLAIGPEYVSELDVLCKSVGFFKRNQVVQYTTFGVACSNNFNRNASYWLYYTKHKSKFTFNKDDQSVRVPSARQLKYKDKRGNSVGKLPDNIWVLHPDDVRQSVDPGSEVWRASRVAGTFKERVFRGKYGGGEESKVHTCPQMPLEVLDRIILSTSGVGDKVLDPFAGTFSTGASAVALGRHFTGIELSDVQCLAGDKRLEESLDRFQRKAN